ncbi:hypothetical protein PCANC_08594 [Puccinia coronata f. sp. avenae]|uniref:Uncharacterized protein n=1 Tax=Puccinia coronata f. sp. avenae TaxID=200324 RepID=A0A2N5S9X1_9BASI|nr:hypothetical protein PCANC_22762 [Puccinia coronata f. sp. avenae]PLW42545.1 hypothetical protein PCANC_08594 [Puccinia coronata f. sp. avenae]
MILGFTSGFENKSTFVNIVVTNSAMVDWTLDPNPATFNPSGEQQSQDSSHVPIILRYSAQTLATLKPPNLRDLIDEAAVEFRLDPNSIYLAILINQCPVKISLSLYRRIAPLSTIHVQLNTPSPIFGTLPGYSESIPCPDPPASTSTNATATTSMGAATSSYPQSHADQVIHDLLNSLSAVSPAVTALQPLSVNNPSPAAEIPPAGSSPPAIVDLGPSPTATNGIDSLHLSKENLSAPRSSFSSSTTTAGITSAVPTPAAANGTTSENNQSMTRKSSKKRFLINSLASSNPSKNQQSQRHQNAQEQDPHQTRRSKFPFLAKRQSSSGSPSSSNALLSSTAMSVAGSTPDTSPRPSGNASHSNRHPSSDIFAADLFKNFPAT